MISRFLILILACSSLYAETWIEVSTRVDQELAKTPKDWESNPGKWAGVNDPSYLYCLKWARATEEVLKGSPAKLPSSIDLFDSRPSFARSSFLQKLFAYHAGKNDWERAFSFLELTTKYRRRTFESSPLISDFMTHRIPVMGIVESLPFFKSAEDRKKTFKRLLGHYQNLRNTEEDLLLAVEGEGTFSADFARNLPRHIKEAKLGLTVSECVPENLQKEFTIESLVLLSHDPDTSEKWVKEDNKRLREWIASNDSLETYTKSRTIKPVRSANYYKTHPNGLFELVTTDDLDDRLYLQILFCRERDFVNDLVFEWLQLESVGKRIHKLSDLRKAPLPKFLADELLQIDFKKREIVFNKKNYPETPLKVRTTKVPNLFQN